MKRKAAFLLAMLLSSASVMPVQASGSTGLEIQAEQDHIIIKATGDGGQVIEHEPYSYEDSDSLRGKGTASAGENVGYVGSGDTLTLSRYKADGSDRAYDKFYLQTGSGTGTPYYATSVYHSRGLVRFAQDSIKGLFNEHTKDMTFAKDLKCSSITLNLDISRLFAPGMKNGSDTIAYENQGRTYYFSKSAVKDMDERVSSATKLGMNVTGVLTPWKGTKNGAMTERVTDRWPSYMSYEENQASTSVPLTGINTSNAEGEHAFEALMEFMADRYSRNRDQGFIQTFVVSNEIDFTPYFCTGMGFDGYMEEYTRCLRIANTAVKKYCADMDVAVPFTHYWNETGTNVGFGSATNFSPRKMLDWMNKHMSEEGDFDWAICPHLYSAISTSSAYALSDSKSGQVTGDVETSKLLTFSNLEILDEYLRRPENMYMGQKVRWVYLNEGGISSSSGTEQKLNEQAASLLQAYCKASQFSEIRQYNYYRMIDNEEFETGSGLNVGLLNADWSMKPAYYAYKHIDDEQSKALLKHYMPYISFRKNKKILTYGDGISSVPDIMAVTDSKINWNEKYDPNKVIRQSLRKPKADIKKMTIPRIGVQSYSGDELKPDIAVMDGRKRATVKITYSKNINPGTATAVIRGIGRYTGRRTVRFKIIKRSYDTESSSHGIIPKQSELPEKKESEKKVEKKIVKETEKKNEKKNVRKGSILSFLLGLFR